MPMLGSDATSASVGTMLQVPESSLESIPRSSKLSRKRTVAEHAKDAGNPCTIACGSPEEMKTRENWAYFWSLVVVGIFEAACPLSPNHGELLREFLLHEQRSIFTGQSANYA